MCVRETESDREADRETRTWRLVPHRLTHNPIIIANVTVRLAAGEDGYFRIALTSCGIETQVTLGFVDGPTAREEEEESLLGPKLLGEATVEARAS